MKRQGVWAEEGSYWTEHSRWGTEIHCRNSTKGQSFSAHFYWSLGGKRFLFLSVILNLDGEKFGSEVRLELVGGCGQNRLLIFHLFPLWKLTIDVHYSGTGHLKSSCPYPRRLFSIAPLPEHGRKGRWNSNRLESDLVRRLRKPFSYNHFLKLYGLNFTTIMFVKSNIWELAVA